MIGYEGGLLNNKYLDEVINRFNLDPCGVKSLNDLEYQVQIGNINEKKYLAEKLNQIFQALNPLVSYSMAFIVYHNQEYTFKTIGKHYLVNKTTNSHELINDLYKKIQDIRLRYNFMASDTLNVKF
jgi:hypothetical protein